jgi:hypothetical protein
VLIKHPLDDDAIESHLNCNKCDMGTVHSLVLRVVPYHTKVRFGYMTGTRVHVHVHMSILCVCVCVYEGVPKSFQKSCF